MSVSGCAVAAIALDFNEHSFQFCLMRPDSEVLQGIELKHGICCLIYTSFNDLYDI